MASFVLSSAFVAIGCATSEDPPSPVPPDVGVDATTDAADSAKLPVDAGADALVDSVLDSGADADTALDDVAADVDAKTCVDACVAGVKRCDGATASETCAPGAEGCLEWSPSTPCPSLGTCGGAGICTVCVDGAKRCGPSGDVETCSGSAWAKSSTCTSGCSAGACLASCPTGGCVSQIAMGTWSSCARLATGTLRCWGANNHGQVGDGTTTQRLVPTESAITGVTDVSLGGEHTCAATGGGVSCWGYGEYGQLGDASGDHVLPTPVAGFTTVRLVEAGLWHSCVLRTDGSVVCFGANHHGQIGDGTYVKKTTPTVVTGLALPAVRLHAKGAHTCALLDDKTVSCWGSNVFGTLGIGSLTPIDRPTPAVIAGVTDIVEVAGGNYTVFARSADGTVRAWGDNEGEIGDGTAIMRLSPVVVPGLVDVAQIAGGEVHTCARMMDGTVRCWGDNTYGQLGDGTASTVERLVPAVVPGMTDVAQIAAANQQTCVLRYDSSIWCWGWNGLGQLGDGTTIDRHVPVRVAW